MKLAEEVVQHEYYEKSLFGEKAQHSYGSTEANFRISCSPSLFGFVADTPEGRATHVTSDSSSISILLLYFLFWRFWSLYISDVI